jgi:hypothetical protein
VNIWWNLTLEKDRREAVFFCLVPKERRLSVCTERRLTPAAAVSIQPVQWVAFSLRRGGCTVPVGSGCSPGLRVLSRVSPSIEPRLPSLHQELRFARAAHGLGGMTRHTCFNLSEGYLNYKC